MSLSGVFHAIRSFSLSVSFCLLFPCLLRISLPRIHDGQSCGVLILGAVTKGKVQACDVYGNKAAGVQVSEGADPLVADCK